MDKIISIHSQNVLDKHMDNIENSMNEMNKLYDNQLNGFRSLENVMRSIDKIDKLSKMHELFVKDIAKLRDIKNDVHRNDANYKTIPYDLALSKKIKLLID